MNPSDLLQLLIAGVSSGCVYGLIALGFVLIYKATEMVNFAQGDLMMVGAFLAVTFISLMELPYFVGIVLTLLVMGGFGVAIERFFMRPMIGEPPFAVLMLTIGLGFILRAVAGTIWGNDPKTLTTPYSNTVFQFGDVVIGAENIAIVVGTALLCGLLYLFFRYSRIGIAMQATSQNQLAAYYVGIPVKRIVALTWGLSAIIAAFAGILNAPITHVEPQLGFIGIMAFAAAIVGGFGSLPGALVGGILVGIVEQFANRYLADGSGQFSAYVFMIVMLFLRPQGIFASMQQKKV